MNTENRRPTITSGELGAAITLDDAWGGGGMNLGPASALGPEPAPASPLADGTPAGQVSSGAYGYTVGKSLAIAYLLAGVAGPGDEVEVAILGRPHKARVLDKPPFDPDGHRLRDREPMAVE